MKHYDSILIFDATNCNPNGDPLTENRPRMDSDGYGMVSAGCMKHKIRLAAHMLSGKPVYVLNDPYDGCYCLKERLNRVYPDVMADNKKSHAEASRKLAEIMQREFYDCRLFGYTAPEGGFSQRACVTIEPAVSADPIIVNPWQITKCIGLEIPKNDKGEDRSNGRSSDMMGSYHYVQYGLYVAHGSISAELAEKYGVTDEDIELLKKSIIHMFDFDPAEARPAGSLTVRNLIWFEQDGHEVNPAKIRKAVHVEKIDAASTPKCYEDYRVTVANIEGVHITELVK